VVGHWRSLARELPQIIIGWRSQWYFWRALRRSNPGGYETENRNLDINRLINYLSLLVGQKEGLVLIAQSATDELLDGAFCVPELGKYVCEPARASGYLFHG
jgi:hypothetical protein